MHPGKARKQLSEDPMGKIKPSQVCSRRRATSAGAIALKKVIVGDPQIVVSKFVELPFERTVAQGDPPVIKIL
jgi:hypothetical protein